jgi:hypothetical protein
MAEADEFQQLTPLIEGLLDAAFLIEPGSLRVLAANSAAVTLFGIEAAALCQAAPELTPHQKSFGLLGGARSGPPCPRQTAFA